MFFILKVFAITVLLLFILDVIYTSCYLNSTNRGKIEYIFNSKPQNYDVIIIGSSRASNHFVTKMFVNRGLNAFNFGMEGSSLFESDLVLKLMLEKKNVIKNVILEVDLNLSNDQQAEGVAASFLPYIHNSEMIKNHFMNQENFGSLYYNPFYRYIKYETRIGIRETFFTAIQKGGKGLYDFGYLPLTENKLSNMNIINIEKLKPLPHNKYYEEIKSVCKANKINFIAVMTPMCENVVGMNYFDKVKKAYPEIHNYENVVLENKYFASCGHMNDAGARLFTARILQDFFYKY